jgi:hypothetical protein
MKEGRSLRKSQISQAKKNHYNFSRQQTTVGVILLATLVGTLIRSFFVLNSDFPLNDGGMFYTMIKDLQSAHFHLPAFTSYNQANIPFAYPPLPFYLAGAMNSWMHIEIIQLLRFIPLIFSILSIPAFYWLASQLLKTDTQRGIAVFIFALLPSAYNWQIMGGGLTRSMAFFFSILALAVYVKWIKLHHWLDFVGIIILTSLTVLSHLEMLWTLALSYLLILLIMQRSWKTLGKLFLAAGGVLLLTAFWWGTVIEQHGISPFLQALHNGGFNLGGSLVHFIIISPGQDLILSLFSICAFIGIFIGLRDRDWFLPIWWLVFILFDPRSSARSAAIPVALLVGITLELWLSWMSRYLSWRNRSTIAENIYFPDFNNGWIKVILTAIIFFVMLNDLIGYYSSSSLLATLNKENREAMQWVKENTPTESRFLAIDYPSAWSSDMVDEWFPSLSERVSILTAQGKEWLPGGAQAKVGEALDAVIGCRENGLNCLETWAKESQTQYDYVYFTLNTQPFEKSVQYTSIVEVQMEGDPGYQLVYKNNDVRIYKKK